MMISWADTERGLVGTLSAQSGSLKNGEEKLELSITTINGRFVSRTKKSYAI